MLCNLPAMVQSQAWTHALFTKLSTMFQNSNKLILKNVITAVAIVIDCFRLFAKCFLHICLLPWFFIVRRKVTTNVTTNAFLLKITVTTVKM